RSGGSWEEAAVSGSAAVRVAAAALAAAEKKLAAARLDLKPDFSPSAGIAAARWSRAEQQNGRYREGILLQSGSVLDAARTSYLNGRGDFSTVAEDFNLWLDARLQLARREADRFTAWAELETLTGEGELP